MSTDDSNNPPGELSPLDQNDIEALLAQVETEKKELVYTYEGNRFPADQKLSIESYDFRNPVFLTEYDLRQVRIRQEQFIHYLGARLSMFLRMDFGLKMSKLQTIDFTKFTASLPNPIAISLFKIDQLSGVGVLAVNPRLAMTLVDRMLGGKGHSVRQDRYLTEIEVSLLNDVVNIFLEEWCRQWADVQDMNPAIVGNENNGRFLQTAASDAPYARACHGGGSGRLHRGDSAGDPLLYDRALGQKNTGQQPQI
jgi:flagellar motor switch protein FliM